MPKELYCFSWSLTGHSPKPVLHYPENKHFNPYTATSHKGSCQNSIFHTISQNMFSNNRNSTIRKYSLRAFIRVVTLLGFVWQFQDLGVFLVCSNSPLAVKGLTSYPGPLHVQYIMYKCFLFYGVWLKLSLTWLAAFIEICHRYDSCYKVC